MSKNLSTWFMDDPLDKMVFPRAHQKTSSDFVHKVNKTTHSVIMKNSRNDRVLRHMRDSRFHNFWHHIQQEDLI